MKKLVLCICLLLLVGCSNILILNEEGYHLFAYGTFISDTNICLQSHDGFELDGGLYFETIAERPTTVRNVLAKPITLKATDLTGSRYIVLEAGESVVFEPPVKPDDEEAE